MNKSMRQYIGLFSAIIAYYVIHEGAHLVYALWHVRWWRYEWNFLAYARAGSSDWIRDTPRGEYCSIFQGCITKI